MKTIPDFNAKYSEVHASIQADTELVQRIFALAAKEGLKSRSERRYFPVGPHEGIPLGLDLYTMHIWYTFPKTVAHMRLLYENSEGNADLSKVYLRLENKMGILSEDMSNDGVYPVSDRAPRRYLELDLLQRLFVDDKPASVHNTSMDPFPPTTFRVDRGPGLEKRFPIADLDHVIVRPEYVDQFELYCKQYETDERFVLRAA